MHSFTLAVPLARIEKEMHTSAISLCYDEECNAQGRFEVAPLSDPPSIPSSLRLLLKAPALLHQFFRFDLEDVARDSHEADRQRIAAERLATLKGLERIESRRSCPVRALFSQLGHKGDLILIHFRDSLEALNQVELDLAQTELYDYPRSSPLVCLGGRTRSLRVQPQDLRSRRRQRSSSSTRPEWNAEIAASLEARRRGHGAAPLPCRSRSKIHLLLSHGPQARRTGATGTRCPSPSASA